MSTSSVKCVLTHLPRLNGVYSAEGDQDERVDEPHDVRIIIKATAYAYLIIYSLIAQCFGAGRPEHQPAHVDHHLHANQHHHDHHLTPWRRVASLHREGYGKVSWCFGIHNTLVTLSFQLTSIIWVVVVVVVGGGGGGGGGRGRSNKMIGRNSFSCYAYWSSKVVWLCDSS